MSPAMCVAGTVRSHRPGPPRRSWVALAAARTADALSRTPFGRPVEPEVGTTNAASLSRGSAGLNSSSRAARTLLWVGSGSSAGPSSKAASMAVRIRVTTPGCSGTSTGSSARRAGDSAGSVDICMATISIRTCPVALFTPPTSGDISTLKRAGKGGELSRSGGVRASEVPGEAGPVGFALLEECVAAFDGFVGHVGQPCRLAGEHLLADHAVVHGVERELQHPLGRGALRVDLRRPVERDMLQLGVGHDGVDHAHPVRVGGGVLVAEEEDLAGELLADLPRQIGRAVPAVERAHVGVGLLEASVLGAGQRQVAHDMQTVASAGGPAGDDGDHDLRHEPDEALDLEDVQAPGAGRVDGVGGLAGHTGGIDLGVLVTGATADAL